MKIHDGFKVAYDFEYGEYITTVVAVSASGCKTPFFYCRSEDHHFELEKISAHVLNGHRTEILHEFKLKKVAPISAFLQKVYF